MNKISLGKLSKGNMSSIKLPKGISITHVVLITISIALLALTIYAAVSYSSGVNKKSDLNRNITLKQQQIHLITLQNIAALQSQLETALQDLTDKSPFPQNVSSIDVAAAIMQAARDTSITCFQYQHQGNGILTINGDDYTRNVFLISLQGATGSAGEKLYKIINFLNELETSSYNTSTNTNTSSISRISLSDSTGAGYWTAQFTLSILSLQ